MSTSTTPEMLLNQAITEIKQHLAELYAQHIGDKTKTADEQCLGEASKLWLKQMLEEANQRRAGDYQTPPFNQVKNVDMQQTLLMSYVQLLHLRTHQPDQAELLTFFGVTDTTAKELAHLLALT